MVSHPTIQTYMKSLVAHLRKLDKADADDVIREIDCHINDVLEQADARGEELDVAALLEGFGPPDVLAAQYIAHIQAGAPPPAGFRVIQRVRRTVTDGLYYTMGAFGFSIAGALLMLALAKVMAPSSVGAWSTGNGHSVILTWSGSPGAGSDELLGYGLVPIALLGSLFCAELTRRVLRALQAQRRING